MKIIKAFKTIRAIKRFQKVGFDFLPMPLRTSMKIILEFRKTLTPETDRGCALMAAAFLDEKLIELLRKNLADDVRLAVKVFEPNGALGTFSARIDMAYLLGLIPKNAQKDLHILRKIRNEFAHVPDKLTFDDPNIAARCRQLYFDRVTDDGPSRVKFVRAMMGLVGVIEGKIIVSKHAVPEPDLDLYSETELRNAYSAYLKEQGADIPKPDYIRDP